MHAAAVLDLAGPAFRHDLAILVGVVYREYPR